MEPACCQEQNGKEYHEYSTLCDNIPHKILSCFFHKVKQHDAEKCCWKIRYDTDIVMQKKAVYTGKNAHTDTTKPKDLEQDNIDLISSSDIIS